MQKYTILIVEDDQHIGELIDITLSDPEYSKLYVDNGIAARAKLIDEPDLVILDIMIPEPDGWKLYKEIRSNPKLDKTRVLIFTALILAKDFVKSKAILPSDLLMYKPFELKELKSNVRKLLGISRRIG